MRIYQTLIMEDSPQAIAVLKEELAKIPFFGNPTVASTVAEARQLLKQRKFDLLLVDIKLGGESTLSLFAANGNFTPKIAVTSYTEHSLDCFDLGFSDYLVKPFTSERFMRAINKSLHIEVNKTIFITRNFIFLKVGRTYQRFAFNEIDYIEAYGIYSKLFYKDQFTMLNETISVLVDRLPANRFMRVHKSFLVNLGNITVFGNNQLLVGQARIPIGNFYKKEFENLFQLFYADPQQLKEGGGSGNEMLSHLLYQEE